MGGSLPKGMQPYHSQVWLWPGPSPVPPHSGPGSGFSPTAHRSRGEQAEHSGALTEARGVDSWGLGRLGAGTKGRWA